MNEKRNEAQEKRNSEVGLVVRLRLPPHAARVLGALEVKDRTAVVMAGLRAMGLLPEEEAKPRRRSKEA